MEIFWPLISGMRDSERSLSSFGHFCEGKITLELRRKLSSQELAL